MASLSDLEEIVVDVSARANAPSTPAADKTKQAAVNVQPASNKAMLDIADAILASTTSDEEMDAIVATIDTLSAQDEKEVASAKAELRGTMATPQDQARTADAYNRKNNSELIINATLQKEKLSAQNDALETLSSITPETQKALVERQQVQAAELQELSEEIESEAAEGGFGYFIKSAMNADIFGNPLGLKGIELNQRKEQYDATVAEINNNNLITQSVLEQEASTMRLVNEGTIAASTELIAAANDIEKQNALLAQRQSNAGTLKVLLGSSGNKREEYITRVSLIARVNENNVRAQVAALNAKKAAKESLLEDIAYQRSVLALQREQIDTDFLADNDENRRKLALVELEQRETDLTASQLRLSLSEESFDSELAIIKNRADQTTSEAELAKISLNDETDPVKVQAKRATWHNARLEAERAAAEYQEWIDDKSRRLGEKEAIEEQRQNQIRLQELQIRANEATGEGKIAATNALNAEQVRQLNESKRVRKEAVAKVRNYEAFVYGKSLHSDEQIGKFLEEGNELYLLMSQLAGNPGANGEFKFGNTPAESLKRLNYFRQFGEVSSDMTGVKLLDAANERLQQMYQADPTLIPSPSDELTANVQFNQAAYAIAQESEAEYVFGDSRNILSPPSIPAIAAIDPKQFGKSRLYAILSEQGQTEMNPDQIVSVGLANVAAEGNGYDLDTFNKDLGMLSNAIVINRGVSYSGLETIGIPNSDRFNVRVGRPRGLVFSALNSVTDAINESPAGQHIDVIAGLVAAGAVLGVTRHPTLAAQAGRATALQASTASAASKLVGPGLPQIGAIGTTATTGFGGYAKATAAGTGIYAAMGTALTGGSDYTVVDFNDPTKRLNYLISVMSSTSVGGTSTQDVKAGKAIIAGDNK